MFNKHLELIEGLEEAVSANRVWRIGRKTKGEGGYLKGLAAPLFRMLFE